MRRPLTRHLKVDAISDLEPAFSKDNNFATKLLWLGHASFLITSPGGVTILLDPFGPDLGYPIPNLPKIDLLGISHDHGDHNNTSVAPGAPTVVRGASHSLWHPSTHIRRDVSLTMIGGAYHDEVTGKDRGRTALISLDVAGTRILHLGDIGHHLDVNLQAQCRGHHIVLIPIGGHFTINGTTAASMIESLNGAFVIPMHYRTSTTPDMSLDTLESSKFLHNQQVHRADDYEIVLSTANTHTKPKIVIPLTPCAYQH